MIDGRGLSDFFAAFNIAEGNLWALVVITALVAPSIAGRTRGSWGAEARQVPPTKYAPLCFIEGTSLNIAAAVEIPREVSASPGDQVVPSIGFEPTTYRLGGDCSSAELRGQRTPVYRNFLLGPTPRDISHCGRYVISGADPLGNNHDGAG